MYLKEREGQSGFRRGERLDVLDFERGGSRARLLRWRLFHGWERVSEDGEEKEELALRRGR